LNQLSTVDLGEDFNLSFVDYFSQKHQYFPPLGL